MRPYAKPSALRSVYFTSHHRNSHWRMRRDNSTPRKFGRAVQPLEHRAARREARRELRAEVTALFAPAPAVEVELTVGEYLPLYDDPFDWFEDDLGPLADIPDPCAFGYE